jgi:hypothetical protein
LAGEERFQASCADWSGSFEQRREADDILVCWCGGDEEWSEDEKGEDVEEHGFGCLVVML